MLRRNLILAVATLCLATSFAFAAGKPVGDFTLKAAGSNETFTLSQARGKYVALHFLLKTECPICARHTHQHSEGARSRDDIIQIFIKPDEEAEIVKWTSHVPKGSEDDVPVIYRDPSAQLAKKLGIPNGYQFHGETVHYPALVLIDPEGNEAFRYVGRNNRERFTWAQLAAKLDAEKSDSKPAASKPTSGPAAKPTARPRSRPASKPSY